ncbi:MAG: hypothetical protein K2W95_26790 [Candidatus Obscuribacterales bacterium]|nr:hypothetical protein [Candidatus Obscuribacterales bacterium]
MYRTGIACATLIGLLLTSSGAALAQSWGQYKQEAIQAESAGNFALALEYWQKALSECDSGGPRSAQCIAGLARGQSALSKNSEAESNYKKLVELIPSGVSLDEDSRKAITEYLAFLRKIGKESEAVEQEKKYCIGAASEVVPAPAASTSKRSAADSADSDAAMRTAQLNTLFNSGLDQLSKKQYTPAEKTLKEALVVAENLKNVSSVNLILAKLVLLGSEQKRFDICEAYAAKIASLVRQQRGPGSVEYARALSAHAGWLRKLNRKQEAMAEEARAEVISASANSSTGSGGAPLQTVPTGVDVSGTKGGSMHSRARAAQSGFNDVTNKMLEQN